MWVLILVILGGTDESPTVFKEYTYHTRHECEVAKHKMENELKFGYCERKNTNGRKIF